MLIACKARVSGLLICGVLLLRIDFFLPERVANIGKATLKWCCFVCGLKILIPLASGFKSYSLGSAIS